MPFEERWKRDEVEALRGTVAQPDPNMPGLHIPVRIRAPPAGAIPAEPTKVRDTETQARKMYLNRKDFEKYGYSVGCKGCHAAQANMRAQPHTGECRKRTEAAINADPAQATRIEDDFKRQCQFELLKREREKVPQDKLNCNDSELHRLWTVPEIFRGKALKTRPNVPT